MAHSKEDLAGASAKHEHDEPLPGYEEPNTAGPSSAGPGPSTPAPSGSGRHPQGPTIDSPFDFPTDIPLPPYSAAVGSSSSSVSRPLSPSHSTTTPSSSSRPPPRRSPSHHSQKPIAIPQTTPDPTSPFLPSYPPALLAYGIPPGSFAAFLTTLSAFLGARVSERAVSHAADLARSVGDVPRDFGRQVASRARAVGQHVGAEAKRGNVVGAAAGVIAGAVTLPVGAVLGAVGAAVRMPIVAAGAATRKPHNPRERAETYCLAANRRWFAPRGLRAELRDTRELGRLVGASEQRLVEVVDGAVEALARKGERVGNGERVGMLGEWIAELEVEESAADLVLGTGSLWLVMTLEHH
ncbi:hypothetical protein F4778DRAFT_801568 [Xylariomycetidae sp. FL2044]|nr:hypothetical protein F4778DRAFT_801568 [Xylariomycetidae sp. FL2044]